MALGGVDEIGKNMYVFEYEDDIVVIDCGSIFPKEDMLGVDLVIPDVSYLVSKRKNVRGYLLTHGHEDHIGATPYILRQVPAPLYGTKLTLALVELKLKEHRIAGIPMNVVSPRDEVRLGKFTAKFIHVSHSIAGACAIALTCPAGTVLFSGDFKVDYTPIDGEIIDLQTLAGLGEQGVMALMCESTNVERPGHTMSELKVGQTFEKCFEEAAGRVIVAMFASNIHRMQMVIDNGIRFGRRVCFIGRSMVNVSHVAMEIGELRIPEGWLIDQDDLDRFPDSNILVMTTGSQGEPMAGLTRMAYAEHRKLQIRPTDTVIISATPIPGNEKFISRVINQLYRCGAQVVYSAMDQVHVSGHACQEELKLMHALVRPKYFIPIHGEYRMLWQHAELAESMGMDRHNIVLPEIGQVIEMNADTLALGEVVPSGTVLVDGLGVGDVGNVVLRDRKHLSEDGLIITVMAIDRDEARLVSGPDIISRGFIYVRENEDIIDNTRELVREILSASDLNGDNWPDLKNRIKDEVHRFIFEKIKRNPMVLPIILDV
ncbi:MAG: ribonuclease J [Clostridia bacterium]|nr:ribonuclease J [Clostridia bacterium]MBR4459584.1 ribonuclease J [Clostridia bacterium]